MNFNSGNHIYSEKHYQLFMKASQFLTEIKTIYFYLSTSHPGSRDEIKVLFTGGIEERHFADWCIIRSHTERNDLEIN